MRKVLVVDKEAGSHAHLNTREILENALISHGIDYIISARESVKTGYTAGDFDLIISIGGDGTFLQACQLVDNSDTPVFGINSDDSLSEGYLLDTNHSELETRLEELLLSARMPVTRYSRLVAVKNNRQLPVKALNEVYIGRIQSYKTTRYEIALSTGSREKQKSSGLLIATGIGSTAWFKSAGGVPFSRHAGYSRFIVRECYQGRLTGCCMTEGQFSDYVNVRILANDTVIAMDSNEEYYLSEGDTITVNYLKDSISIVNFVKNKPSTFIDW